MTDRTSSLYRTLVYLADTLVAGFDVLDVADEIVRACTDMLGADAAGIMLDDQRGTLRLLASSSERTEMLELLELQTTQGPCLLAFNTGQAVAVPDLPSRADDWPDFVAEAAKSRIYAAYAIPMRLRDNVIGAVNLFCSDGRTLTEDNLELAHLVANIAAIGIITHRTIRQHELLAEQLQSALNSRIVIEQAKGVIAERSRVSMGEAFELLRAASRASRRPLSEVAADVARRKLSPDNLARITDRGRTAPGT